MTFADLLPSLLFAMLAAALVAFPVLVLAATAWWRATGYEVERRVALSEAYAFRDGVYRAAPPLALPFAPTCLSVRPVADDAAPPAVRPPRTDALPSSGVVVALFGEEPLPPRDTEPGEPWDDVESGRRPCIRPEPLSPLRLPALRPLDDGARVSPVTPRGPQS